MSDSERIRADYEALNNLIVNCPDFDRLEALLGGFNLFQVLKFEHGEIRHSNVLAWILDPSESHGLDSTFLKKWLMRVIHEASGDAAPQVSAVDIDAWRLLEVEVLREWRNIDLLLILTFADASQWVICIENKINSAQHSNQLGRYRAIVEDSFPAAARRLFIFLTKYEETPEDVGYLCASYTQVHQSLAECLQSRTHSIGAEPRVLLENYLRLLEEKFMDESEIARTALRIYQQHRRALDVIFEHRPDTLADVSEKVRKLFEEHAAELGIVMQSYSKHYIRFIPRVWDQPGNCHGEAWPGTRCTVLFEISFNGQRPYSYVISGKAPDAWIEPIWQQTPGAPFDRPKREKRPKWWVTLHVAGKNRVSLNEEDLTDPTDVARKIYDFNVAWFRSAATQEVVAIIAGELPRLEAMHASTAH